MNKRYRHIEVWAGTTIDSAIEELSKHEDLVCIDFNGQTLYSDVDNLDSAYKKITGKTKAEFDEAEKQRQIEYQAQEKKHKDSIPQLTKEWIEKGKAVLDEKYHDLWIKCVPIRLGDLYKGMELGCTLDIVKQLNDGCELDEAEKTIQEQGHSGMSFGLVCSMVKSFCNRGAEFVEHVK